MFAETFLYEQNYRNSNDYIKRIIGNNKKVKFNKQNF